MFTIVPSLFLIGRDLFIRWKVRKNSSILVNESLINRRDSIGSTSTLDRSESVSVSSKRRSIRSSYSYRKQRRKIFEKNLSEADFQYLMRKTGFSRDQIFGWLEEFFHECPDGKLSKPKFIEIYQNFYPKGDVTKFCNEAFRIFDRDASGFLDFVEFLLAITLTSSKDPTHKLNLFFSMCDADGNGRIDQQEMSRFIESIYALLAVDTRDPTRIDSKVAKIFSETKLDSKGRIKKEQFTTACQIDRHIRTLLSPAKH